MSGRTPDDRHGDSRAGEGDRPPERDPERPHDVRHRAEEAHVDDVLSALGHRVRRHVLGYLRASADGVATFDDLAEHLSAVSTDDPETVRIGLHHRHLPVLDEAGLVDYDPTTDVVTTTRDELADGLLATVEATTAFSYAPGEK